MNRNTNRHILQPLANLARAVGDVIPRRTPVVGQIVRVLDEDGNERIGVLQSLPKLSPYFSEELQGIERQFVTSLPGEEGRNAWTCYARPDQIWFCD